MSTTRTNLCSNPSFETNTTGWSAIGTGVAQARITTDGAYGTACLQITKAANANQGSRFQSAAASMVPATTYSFSTKVKIPAGMDTGDFYITVQWQDNAAANIGSAVSSSTTVVAEVDGWTDISYTATSPALTDRALVYVRQLTAGTAAKTFLIDGMLIEASATPLPYFDGSTSDWYASYTSLAWTGTAHASTSVMTLAIDTFTAVIDGQGKGYDVTINAPGFTTFTLTRAITGGASSVVRGANNADLDGVGAAYLFDVEVPQNTEVRYFLEVNRVSPAPTSAMSSWITATGQVDHGGSVIFDLAHNSNPVVVRVNDWTNHTYESSSESVWVHGRSDPVVIGSTRRLPSGVLTLLTLNNEEAEAIMATLAGGITCYAPRYPEPAGIPKGIIYLSVSRVSEARLNQQGEDPARLLALDVQEIAPPPADFIAQTAYTWDEVIALGLTWDALAASYTWDELAYG